MFLIFGICDPNSNSCFDQLLPANYPEAFQYELSIGEASKPDIIRKLQRFAFEAAPPPPITLLNIFNYPSDWQAAGSAQADPVSTSERCVIRKLDHIAHAAPPPPPLPGSLPVCHLLNGTAEDDIDLNGLLGGAFDAQDDALYHRMFRSLSDLPALQLGVLGASDPPADQPLPSCESVASAACPARAASPGLPAAVFAQAMHVPTYAEKLSPLFSLPADEPPAQEPDAFSNFEAPPMDYEAWVMHVSPSKRAAPARPKKRARAQA